jgi:hypothetical protein
MEVKLCAHSHLEQCRRCSARPRRFAELIMAMCLENGYGYGSIPKWYNFLGDERGWIYKIPMMGMGQNLSLAYFGWTNIHKSHELMWTTGLQLQAFDTYEYHMTIGFFKVMAKWNKPWLWPVILRKCTKDRWSRNPDHSIPFPIFWSQIIEIKGFQPFQP